METYKHLALGLFRNIRWSDPTENSHLEELTQKEADRRLMEHQEIKNSLAHGRIPDDLHIPMQEDKIERLIQELAFYRALALKLELKLRVINGQYLDEPFIDILKVPSMEKDTTLAAL